MTLLNTVNVGGTDFGLLNSTAIGACSTPAGNEVKECTFADSFELKAGVVVTVTFTYANTYGNGSTTYPKLSVNGTSYPIKYATNAYAGAGAWVNGQTVPFMFDGTGFILVANLMQTSVISSANTTVNGAPLYNGANIKVMFTSALAGTDTSTALVLSYNGSNITVKVPVNGALTDYVAKAVDESGTTAYYFCQAYTTLELLFDGTYFVITNNPVVISNSDYTIYADGSKAYKTGYAIDNSKFLTGIDFNNFIGIADAVVTYAILGHSSNLNAPTTQNGFLTVYNSTTRDRITQTYKSNQTYYIWERVYDIGVWGNWALVTFN